jgi:cell wall-associated NlpC family hydrolase
VKISEFVIDLGTTTNGYDCSGLVFSTFLDMILLPELHLINQNKELLGNNLEARKGDLIFFKTNSRSQINHVGIVTDVNNDEVRFIHTSTSKGYNLLYKRTILSENFYN